MEKLIVFDLQRFALHDGPGIRTTVFLKGCPLDCLWCHNPESKKAKLQLGFLEKKCTACGKCADICKQQVHHFTEEGVHNISYEKCIACGACVNACGNEALKMYGKQCDLEEILQTVLKDKDFYERSKGGLTVSGGEPMMQFPALKTLLKKAKEAGLHVCLDTCGQAPQKNYAEIAQYVDLFLFDYKITDSAAHKCYTGVDNSLILSNLDYLCTHGNDVFLRCPIIPGINDNEEHYQAIAELSKKYDSIRQVNLMTYHDMAKGKAAQIGVAYELAELKTIEEDKKREIYEKVASFGCRNLMES